MLTNSDVDDQADCTSGLSVKDFSKDFDGASYCHNPSTRYALPTPTATHTGNASDKQSTAVDKAGPSTDKSGPSKTEAYKRGARRQKDIKDTKDTKDKGNTRQKHRRGGPGGKRT